MRKRILPVLLVFVLLSSLAGQTTQKGQQFQPTVGQPGKDVIWVPTPEALVEEMLNMAKVTAADTVIDLGSGDGRIPIAAAKRGARAMGVEYNPDMVALSRENAKKEGVSEKATYIQADIFETDFSKATVVTMYLLSSLNMKLRPKLYELKPGTRIVSHAFTLEDWEPDQTSEVEYQTAYLWIVPAKVGGVWTWAGAKGSDELTLRQTFQKIEGSLKAGGKDLPIKNAKLDGEKITFTVDEGGKVANEYSGRVTGDVIQGSIKGATAAAVKWTAGRRKTN